MSLLTPLIRTFPVKSAPVPFLLISCFPIRPVRDPFSPALFLAAGLYPAGISPILFRTAPIARPSVPVWFPPVPFRGAESGHGGR
jgi:hypothetical protein